MDKWFIILGILGHGFWAEWLSLDIYWNPFEFSNALLDLFEGLVGQNSENIYSGGQLYYGPIKDLMLNFWNLNMPIDWLVGW